MEESLIIIGLVCLVFSAVFGFLWWKMRQRRNFVGIAGCLAIVAPIVSIGAGLITVLMAIHWVRNHFFGVGGPTVVAEVVVSVDSGNQISLKAGFFDRSRRTKTGTLWGIEIPVEAKEQAKENLSKFIAPEDEVRMEIKEGGKRIGAISGIVFATNGTNCCLEQLRSGWATATVEDKIFKEAQKEAQKGHKGVWKKKTRDEAPVAQEIK